MPAYPRILALPLALVAFAAAACSSPASEGPESDDGISIVASTPIWADVAQTVADSAAPDADVTVSSVVRSVDVDPHHFEPTAADVARANDADIVVVGGGGYDSWLYEALSDQDKIVSALPLIPHGSLGEHAEQADITVIDGNEHVWYDPEAIDLVAEDIAEALTEAGVEADAETVKEHTAAIDARLHTLPALDYAQTEPIADYLLAHSEMKDVTPADYRQATLSHREPAAADLARFLQAIGDGDVELLIYNPQTKTDLTGRIRAAAESAGIPVVEIGETPTDGSNFFDYYDSVLDELEAQAGAVDAA